MEEGVRGRAMTAEFAPIDKSKVNEAVFRLLDLINRHYSENAEILDVAIVAWVEDGGERYIDCALSEGTTVGAARHMLSVVHESIRPDQ